MSPVTLFILLLISPFLSIYLIGRWRPALALVDRVVFGLLIAVLFGLLLMAMVWAAGS